jgi:hypothetical protein
VSFLTYSLTDDRCLRLLIKNLGNRMPESDGLEKLIALDSRVQAVMLLRSDRRDQDSAISTSLCL